MFISGGENVYPAEVEKVLRHHPAVEDIAVIGVPDETWGEVGYAFVIPKSGKTLKAEDLMRSCDGQLARYKWPKKVLFFSDFPYTALGKVRKTELKKQYEEMRDAAVRQLTAPDIKEGCNFPRHESDG